MKKVLIFLTTVFSLVSFSQNELRLNSSSYSFGGECASQGSWTQAAIMQMSEIKSTINSLKNEQSCNADTLNSVLEGIDQINLENLDKDDQNNQIIPEEINAIRSLYDSGLYKSDANSLLGLMMQKTVDDKDLSFSREQKDLLSRANRTHIKGMGALKRILQELPNLKTCLYNKPGITKSFFGSVFKVMSAFVSSGKSSLSEMGDLFGSYTKWLQENRFANVVKDLNTAEFLNSVSCMVESTTELYCKGREALDLQNMLLDIQEEKLKDIKVSSSNDYNPLEGYFILTRDSRVISDWIQIVQFGVKPKLITDAQFKNTTLDNLMGMIKDVNSALATVNYSMMNRLPSIIDIESKRNFILKDVLLPLTRALGEGSGWGASKGDINFFDQTINSDLMPFFFIGRQKVPTVVAIGEKGVQINWNDYMFNKGDYVEEFKDPDWLMAKIISQLNELIQKAERDAAIYFQENYVVDLDDLASKSVVSQTITVLDGLKRIDKYLSKLSKRVENTPVDKVRSEDKVIYPNIMNTRGKIKAILDVVDEIEQRSSSSIFALKGMSDDDVLNFFRSDKNFSKLYKKFINQVYWEFNVLIQREAFLPTRLGTFVKYDLAFHSQNNKNLTNYEEELMLAAGESIISKLFSGSLQADPQKVREDLAHAQYINKVNLKAVEDLFSDSMIPMISNLKRIEEGKVVNDANNFLDSFGRFLSDSFTSNYSGSIVPFIYNQSRRSDRYPYSNPFNSSESSLGPDEFKSVNYLKSKLCLQTLSFDQKRKFIDLCLENSTMEGPFSHTEPSKGLNLSYSKQLYEYLKAVKSGSRFEVAKAQGDNICAIRNFRRKNRVFWLLNNFR